LWLRGTGGAAWVLRKEERVGFDETRTAEMYEMMIVPDVNGGRCRMGCGRKLVTKKEGMVISEFESNKKDMGTARGRNSCRGRSGGGSTSEKGGKESERWLDWTLQLRKMRSRERQKDQDPCRPRIKNVD